jgi:DNA polymerase-3 subunit alpha
VFAAAETILAHASSAADARSSGQGGLFGEAGSNVVPIRMPASATWTLAQRMAQEKEAFGFYFSAHPVERYRHLAESQGVRKFAELGDLPMSEEGGRTAAVMAALVEEARWRTSARGRRYLFASLSDPSGQFMATVFDETAAGHVEEAARTGACVLLNVELDRRPGEETPRVTIRNVQPFDSLSRRTRLQLEVEVDRAEALTEIAEALASHRGGNGQMNVRVPLDVGHADLLLGRDFQLDAEIEMRVARIDGVTSVRLSAAPGPRLALVS